MNKAFNILIILALLLGGACVFLIIQYGNSRAEQARADTPSVEVVSKDVLVAKLEILPGMQFNEKNVEVKKMPENFVPASAVTSMEELTGKFALQPIPVEDMLLATKVGDPSQLPKASLIIDDGKRLVTITAGVLKAVGYTVKNGDRVDLVGLFNVTEVLGDDSTESPLGQILAVTFMQNVEIFDINNGIVGAPAPADGEEGEGAAPAAVRLAQGDTATFQVTPEDAAIILAAEAVSDEISMVLRRFDDTALLEPESDLHAKIISKLTEFEFKEEEVVQAPAPVAAPVQKKTRKVF